MFSSPPYLIPYDNAVRSPWGPVNHKGDGGPSCEENSKVKMAYRTSKDERVELGVVHKKGPNAKPSPLGTRYVPAPIPAWILV